MRRHFFKLVPLAGLLAVGGLSISSGQLPFLGGSQQVAATSYRTMSVTLKDGSTSQVRWNACQKTITYAVNLAGVKSGAKADTLRMVRKGFAKLAAINGISYTYKGTTSFVPTKENLAASPAEIVVAVVNKGRTDFSFAKDTLGVGGVLWNSWTTSSGGTGVAAVRGYAILNASSLPGLKKGFGEGTTQGNLLLHELGHVMGLEHVQTTKNLMDPELTKYAPNAYGPGDKAGLVALADGCIDVPGNLAVKDLN
ncbi:hypothetical protein ACIB24_16375 [Spongisporangium articulatum]|uniref:Uncharacterized protein n=1 Tax=Spongisporangium articulatum TaxID=3362603 RepID=A0ABW8ARD5_9ACTN